MELIARQLSKALKKHPDIDQVHLKEAVAVDLEGRHTCMPQQTQGTMKAAGGDEGDPQRERSRVEAAAPAEYELSLRQYGAQYRVATAQLAISGL